ncbi:HEAT repeat domain-containing protein [Gaoshiqia sediminis]|uniref:HEAT repeat domain-containing protein n=1 Tax=Gaoshiqia sediminis TaxID=2986998 RepID=A0AA41YC59_9BACT|nr:HEAT repeat domain-containing protein [Gaoshiqia sediminis]MCW0483638.1 HEAT repeat domain-containing protein [Gaoshiqia sediminis]
MKRIILFSAIGVVVLLGCTLLVAYIWIDCCAKENITVAQQKYGGTAEEALIAFVRDESNPARDRTHLAVWTLGQIGSEQALPVLHELYHDDPEGKTCKGRHDSVICQYELHKAIESIENGVLLSHARLKR